MATTATTAGRRVEWYEYAIAFTTAALGLFGAIWGGLVTYRTKLLEFGNNLELLETETRAEEIAALREQINTYQRDTARQLSALRQKYDEAIREIAVLRSQLAVSEHRCVLYEEMNALLANQNRMLLDERAELERETDTVQHMNEEIDVIREQLSTLEARSDAWSE